MTRRVAGGPRPLRIRKIQAVSTAAGIATLCAVGLVGPAANGSPDPVPATGVDDQVNDAHDDLAEANSKVAKVAKQLAATQVQLQPAQQRLTNAHNAAEAASAAAAVAQQRVVQAEAAVAAVNADIAKVKDQISDLRAHIGMLARVAYTSGGQYLELQILLESQDPSQFADRLASLNRVSAGNSNALEQLGILRQQLRDKLDEVHRLEAQAQAHRDELKVKQDEAQAALAQAAQAKLEVDRLIAEKKKIVAKAESERTKVKAQYDALLAEQKRIQEQLRKQAEKEQKKKSGGGTTTLPDPAIVATGVLSWPLPGRSAGGRTGWRIHPIYGYHSCHTGDDIGAPSGTPIRSAADGVVLSTESGGPYGNHTLIDHGGGLSTMYAHQSRFGAKPGQRVRKGDVIGYVGATGYATGPHLHFEVHVNGIPWEPMGWFGESKHRVNCV